MPKSRSGLIASGLIAILLCFQNCSTSLGGGPASTQTQASVTQSACLPSSLNNCILGEAASGGTSGTCFSNYSGSCSYSCANGNWVETMNTCTATLPTPSPTPTPTPAACTSTTANGCSLSGTNSGGNGGSCTSGYTGSCSATCNNGAWTITSNSCTAPPPKTYVCQFTQPNTVCLFSSPYDIPTAAQFSTTDACASYCESVSADYCQYVHYDGGGWSGYKCYALSATFRQSSSCITGGPYSGLAGIGACGWQ